MYDFMIILKDQASFKLVNSHWYFVNEYNQRSKVRKGPMVTILNNIKETALKDDGRLSFIEINPIELLICMLI